MKKLKLNVAELGATEILTREELKKVLGGTGSGSGSGIGYVSGCGKLGQAHCGDTAGNSCKTHSGASGKCKSPQATTTCVCVED